MINSLQSAIFNVQNEHDLEHDSDITPLFSTPKIYMANGDLTKRWYVYFSYRDQTTGKMKRVKNIYGQANKFKTKEKRLILLTVYRKNLIRLLKEGYNPFIDNTEFFKKRNKIEQEKIIEKEKSNIESENSEDNKIEKEHNTQENKSEVVKNSSLPLQDAIDFSLGLKSKQVSVSTFKGYKSKSQRFIKFIQEHHQDITHVNQITKKICLNFLNHIFTSSRNRNNYRTDLSTVFQTLKDNEIIDINYFSIIKKLKTRPEKNKVYSDKKQQEIFNFLEKEDPILLLYIKFISYNFLRPLEVCRLKIGDIDIKERKVKFKAKNSAFKTKIIPDILFDQLPDLSKIDKEFYLFTPDKIGGSWETAETNKRNYFSGRFRKKVKEKFNLSKDYGLYSFRHTFISKLYKKLRENNSPFKAKSDLMLITGHSSMKSLESYLRSFDAELPEDYSNLFN